jgi:uncharacterized membrane protein YhaH (DUF805 family)
MLVRVGIETTKGRRMSFGTAIASGFRHYSNFTGNASRSEFWWFQLFLVLVGTGINSVAEGLSVVWLLAIIVPYLAIGVRRLQDAGLNWAFLLLGLVPVLGTITLIVLWAQPTKATPVG